MKVSFEWLQSYFDEKLPNSEQLTEALTFHAFEVETIEQVGDDTAIDLAVLPNRSSDCLSHRGIAREIATLLKRKLKDDPLRKAVTNAPDSNLLEVHVENPELVNRFSAAVINGIEVGESPEWLKKRLKTIGQRPINNIVDATNYVMFNIGQPLHAFDRDKLKEAGGGYAIAVRVGKRDEKITTLTGGTYEVGAKNLLIVDGNADLPIGIAGVKGGNRAEIDAGTKNIIIEAANFNYASVRKTSQELKLWTDASTRFQNQPSAELTLHALREMVALIGGELEGFVDFYPHKVESSPVLVTVPQINGLLGTDISANEVEKLFQRFDFIYSRDDETFSVTPPFERTDLTIKENVIEEVGRVYGYSHAKAVALPPPAAKPSVNKLFYYADRARALLVEHGFSEVYTHALQPSGEVELSNALAADKPFLRSSLFAGMQASLELNVRNADLLGLEQVRIFEIGTVFHKDGEHTFLALGVKNAKKLKQRESEVIEEMQKHFAKEFGMPFSKKDDHGVTEINFTEFVEKLPEPEDYDSPITWNKTVEFQPISIYPFVLRDIALWVPNGTKDSDVVATIERTGGELLVRSRLFDQFEKEERTSFAFRLVFQSHEKTLSDEEVNTVMQGISEALAKHGWEVR
jgi:phenylalanyl-tRNA synthetase beta chain